MTWGYSATDLYFRKVTTPLLLLDETADLPQQKKHVGPHGPVFDPPVPARRDEAFSAGAHGDIPHVDLYDVAFLAYGPQFADYNAIGFRYPHSEDYIAHALS